MAEQKKFYWLRLKRDFFKRHDIRIIEEMPNGKDYVLFYLKLLLESVDHSGYLRFSETIPYNEQMLSTITNTNIDIVRSALKVLSELQMVDILDDQTLYMSEIDKLVGCEEVTDREHFLEAHRERQKRYRERKNSENLSMCDVTQCHGDVTVTSQRDGEKEIEIEKDIDINNNILAIFDRCWKAYPKKLGKGQISNAKKKKLINEIGEEQLLRCIERYVKSYGDRDKQYMMYGSTFFNSGYVDYLDENYQDNSFTGMNKPVEDDYWQ